MDDFAAAIGFPLETSEAKVRYVSLASTKGETFPTAAGSYSLLRAPCGAELWILQDLQGQPIGFKPFFSGNSQMKVGFNRRIFEPFNHPLAGAFYGWANADVFDDDPEDPFSGDFPFALNIPNFAMYADLQLPSLQTVKVTGFARELYGFEDETAFYQWEQEKGFNFAAQSFFPSTSPDVLLTFAGHILDCAPLTNILTGHPFHWAWLKTFGGEIDVVVHPESLTGPLIPGGTVFGYIWVTAKIL